MGRDMYERASKEAVGQFVTAWEKKGWTLANRPEVYGPFPYHDLATNAVLLDMKSYRVRAIFSIVPKPVRMELPPHTVRQDPDQRVTDSEMSRKEKYG